MTLYYYSLTRRDRHLKMWLRMEVCTRARTEFPPNSSFRIYFVVNKAKLRTNFLSTEYQHPALTGENSECVRWDVIINIKLYYELRVSHWLHKPNITCQNPYFFGIEKYYKCRNVSYFSYFQQFWSFSVLFQIWEQSQHWARVQWEETLGVCRKVKKSPRSVPTSRCS